MRTFTHTLGGQPVTIIAPEVGDFDADAFRGTFPGGGLYGLDVESTYLSDLGQFDPTFDLRLIQFGTHDTAWVLNLADLTQYEAAVSLLRDRTVSFCSHTNMDVLSVAVRLGADITLRNVDTRMLGIMAHPEEGADRDLKSLTAKYIGPEMGEGEKALHAHFAELWTGRKNAKKKDIDAHGWAKVSADEPRYLIYAGLDAVACRRLADILVAETGAPAGLIEKEVWLAGQANRIQLRGLLVDKPVLDEFHHEATSAFEAAKAQIIALTPDEVDPEGVNPQSHVKFREWFGRHGVSWAEWRSRKYPLGKRTKTGQRNPSLAKKNALLLDKFPLDEQARAVYEQFLVLKAHDNAKTRTTEVLKAFAPDGRVHPVLSTMGATSTARMSSSRPNAQNFSKVDGRMRGMFLPSPGNVFLTIDFDQVELRVAAALAGEEKMIQTILDGGDLHQLTVDELASVGVTITRADSKIVNFLILYGGGAGALHQQTGIPLETAEAVIAAHRQRYPAIARLGERMAAQDFYVRTISQRRLAAGRYPNGDPKPYANLNYLIQSSARDLLVDAWYRFAVEFGHADKVWFPIHDEMALEVPRDQVLQVAADAERCFRFDFMGVPISATAELLLDEDGVTSRWMTAARAQSIRWAKGYASEAEIAKEKLEGVTATELPERAYMQAFLDGRLAEQHIDAVAEPENELAFLFDDEDDEEDAA